MLRGPFRSAMLVAGGTVACTAAPAAPPVAEPQPVTVPAPEPEEVGTETAPPSRADDEPRAPASPDPLEVCSDKCTGAATADLRDTLRKAAASVRPCYEQVLRRDPKLAGKVIVVMRIAPDGRPCGISVKPMGSLEAPDMLACIRERFFVDAYPAPTGGCVDVAVPLKFVPKSPSPDAGVADAGAAWGVPLSR